MTDPVFHNVGVEHGVTRLANLLSDPANVTQVAAECGMSRFDVATAFCNAAGHILADSRDMPREIALERMDALRKVIEAAYDLRNVASQEAS